MLSLKPTFCAGIGGGGDRCRVPEMCEREFMKPKRVFYASAFFTEAFRPSHLFLALPSPISLNARNHLLAPVE